MGYASIVVAAAGGKDDAAALSAACELARRHKAVATVVIVVPQVTSAVGAMAVAGARYSRNAWAGLVDSRERLIDATKTQIAEQARRHELVLGTGAAPGVVAAPQAENPWIGLQRELPLADLVVMAQSAAHGEGPWTGILAEALMAGRAPVLIACDNARLAGAPAAVAWDGSPEAGRAVRAAVPLLLDASNVAILQYGGELDTATGSAADPDRLSRYLTAKGVQQVGVLNVEGAKPGPALLQAALSLEATLLVAGAFGHARLAETIFGGATKTFLHAEEGLSVFLSH